MIEWCNDNQGFALVVLTAVYVIATITMVAVMAWSNRLAVDLERARSRPYVIFDIVMTNKLVEAVLKNIGGTAAHNVRVTLSPSISSPIYGGKDLGLLRGPIRFVAPRREIRDFIASGPVFLEQNPDAQFHGQVEYEDAQGRPYSEPLHIDLNFHRGTGNIEREDIGRELRKIRELLERLLS